MTVFAETCAKALLDMGITRAEMQACRALFSDPRLAEALASPAVTQREKEAVISRLFPAGTQTFWKLLCADGWIAEAGHVFTAFEAAALRRENKTAAELTYVTAPDEARLREIKRMICEKEHRDGVELACRQDKSLIGGYCLRIGDMEYDKSIRSGLKRLQAALQRG